MEKLVHTGYGNGRSDFPIKVYVTYSISQDIASNTSSVNTGMYVTTPSSAYNIGPWSDFNGSYVGRTNLTFNGAIPNFGGSRTLTSDKVFTVTHNQDGTGSTTIYWHWGVNSSWGRVVNPSGSFNITLPTIPRQANITSASDFNDEGNPTIKYTNPGGFRVNARLEFGNATIQRDNIGNSGTYTFNLTENERNLLRQKCTGNSMTVREVIATCIGGTTENYWSYQDKTMTIINGNPTFSSSNITYEDTNDDIVAITNNNQHIVQNRSNLEISFTGATAVKSASIVKYEITFNGVTQEEDEPTSINYGTVNSSKDLTVSIKAIDSRGNSKIATKTITILGWVLPTASITSKRVNNYEDDTKLKVAVTISSVNNKNAIQSIKYRYKKSGTSSYTSYASLNDNVETSISIDKLFAWDFQVVMQDKFGTTTYNFTVPKGMPILFIDILLQSIGINCFPSIANSLFVNGINFFDLFPVGSCKMTTNNVNPQTYLAGTQWELTTSGNLISGLNKTFYLWTRTN